MPEIDSFLTVISVCIFRAKQKLKAKRREARVNIQNLAEENFPAELRLSETGRQTIFQEWELPEKLCGMKVLIHR